MRKLVLLNFLIVFCLSTLTAQNENIFVSGKVLDKSTHKGISFANVFIEGTTQGTVANYDGDFEMKIPSQYQNNIIVFSCMGYNSVHCSIKKRLIIYLSENVVELSEVKVKPLKPLELLKKAIAKIPENYSLESVYLDAFYRSLMKEDTTYINLMEAACIFKYEGYTENYDVYAAQKQYFTKAIDDNCTWNEGLNNYFDLYTNPDDQVKIVESRISEYNSNKFGELLIVGGPLNLIAADKVKFLNDFMSEEHFKHYKYKNEGITTFNNREVIVISFAPKAPQFRDYNPSYAGKINRKKYYNAEFEGRIYIDLGSLAFVQFNYHLKKVSAIQGMQPEMLEVRLDYKQINNKWYLSQVFRKRMDESIFKKNIKNDSIVAEEQLIVNKTRFDKVADFNIKEVFPHSNYNTLYRYPMGYNRDYWNNYNNITHNKLCNKAKCDLELIKPLEQQFADMQKRNDSMPMPIAKKSKHAQVIHNDTLIDDYKWLENKEDENVIVYLNDENRYTYNYFVSLRDNQNKLVQDMMQKVPESDTNSNYNEIKNGSYFYYLKYVEYAENPKLCRKHDSIGAEEEYIFDFDSLANKYEYFEIADLKVSPDNNIVLLSIDTIGNQRQTGLLISTKNQQIENESIPDFWVMEWLPDSKSFYYVRQDSKNRPSAIYKHFIGTNVADDTLIYFERDINYDVGIRKSELGNYIFMDILNYNSQELRYLDLNVFGDTFKIFYPREKNHTFTVKEGENDFYILSNKNSINNGLFKVGKENSNYEKWEKVFIPGHETLLKNFYLCEKYVVLSEVFNVNQAIRVLNTETNSIETVKLEEEFYGLNINEPDYYSKTLTFSISTFINPKKQYEYNFIEHSITLKKENKIESYTPSDYAVERVWSSTTDSVKVPITFVYKKKFSANTVVYPINTKVKKDGKRPLILEAYGAYGTNSWPNFSADEICMLDYGFIYAIAHVRGGSELGNGWHEAGKLLNKKNTFDDYIACAKYLINEQYTDSNLLFGIGGSAGGLLMGAVANKKPELFRGLVLEYPMVSILSQLMDSTNMNYLEFGDPRVLRDYDYLKSYSPYDNIRQQKYPAMLFVSGLNDDRVPFWNATKMVAKLRNNNLSNNPILLKTENSGHTGIAGNYEFYKSRAYEYSFFMSLLK